MSTKRARKMAKKDAKTKKAKTTKIPRQMALPGMEDAEIVAIENTALDYAEARDERQKIGLREVELKTKLLDLMHKQGKTKYRRNGISVKVKVEQEKVIVRVREEGDLPASPPEVEVDVPETSEVPF